MAHTGQKGRAGATREKWLSCRHGHGSRRGANALEKAIETKERQSARKQIRRELEDQFG